MQTIQALMIGIDDLFPCSSQPRKSLSREELERVAATVATRGILQPLRVRRDEPRGGWEIITGETRWRAAKLAGLKEVPCVPVAGDLSETDLLGDQLIENLARNALKPMELSRGLAKYKALRKCSSQQMAAELGIKGGTITKSEALLSLPEDIQALVDQGSISPNAAYEISRLPDADSQRALAREVAEGKVNRDATAEAVRAVIGKRNVKPKAARLPLKLDDGISITVSANEPLTWEALHAAIDVVRKQAKRLQEGGKAITDLPRSFRTS